MSDKEMHMLSDEDLKDVTGGYILETVTPEGTRYAICRDHDSTVLGHAQNLDDAKRLAMTFQVSTKVITKYENTNTSKL